MHKKFFCVYLIFSSKKIIEVNDKIYEINSKNKLLLQLKTCCKIQYDSNYII